MAEDLSGLMSTLQGMATKAAEPVVKQDEPGDVKDSVETKDQTARLVSLPMTEAEMGEWWKRIERARQRVKAREETWDTLLDEYLPIVSKSGEPETVKNNSHFRNVHSKIGQLFYRSPDLILEPNDPSPAQNMMPNPMPVPPGMPPLPPLTMEDIIAVKQAVLKKTLGRDGIKANRLMDELLFDTLAWVGYGVCKVGYRCVWKPIQRQKMVPGPMPQVPGAILRLSGPAQPPMVPATDAMGQPVMETVSVPVFEEFYARRVAPKKALWNDDLKSTRFDEDATWMGMEFYLSPKQVRLRYKLTETELSAGAEDDRVHQYKEDAQSKVGGLIRCVEVFCKASVFTDEVHPQALNQLVVIENIKDKPVVWRPSPDQTFDPATGQLTEDSVTGFPYRVLNIRDLADSAFTPSDSAFTNSLIKQLSTWRRQSIQIRDASSGKYVYDSAAFEDTELDQLKNGTIGTYIPVKDGQLSQGIDKILAQTTKVQGSVDDQRGQEHIKQDMDETLGISANQAGVETDTVRTATESANIASAIQARNDKELGRVIDCYLDIARMVDQLLMRYMDQPKYIKIGGEESAGKMQMWTGKMVSGRWLYDIAPDSRQRPDNASDFKSMLEYFNIVALDPLVNRAYLHRRMARMKGLDPAKVIASPEMMAMQPPHGGPGGQATTVNQHQASNSGKRPNEPGAQNQRETQVKPSV